MKFKSFSKRLVLNKKTIVNLGKQELDEVMGGTLTCYTYCNSIAVNLCHVMSKCNCALTEKPLCTPKTS